MDRHYDLVIIGAGVAGLTAAMFGGRYGLKTLLLEHLSGGGQVINAERIDNFPGFPQGVAGYELGPLLQEQVEAAGVDLMLDEASEIRLLDPYWAVSTSDGEIMSKAVIIAAGSDPRRLDIPGEEKLFGAGVSHCATCDGPFFVDEEVAVVGGGDSALDEALSLTQYASGITIFHRGETLAAQQVLQERVDAEPKIQIQLNTQLEAILGEEQVNGVKVKNNLNGEVTEKEVSGVFVYVGLEPNTNFISDILSLDNGGHIPTGIWMETDSPGLYAAGDIRQNSASQLVSAAGDGATSAIAAFRYISSRNWPPLSA